MIWIKSNMNGVFVLWTKINQWNFVVSLMTKIPDNICIHQSSHQRINACVLELLNLIVYGPCSQYAVPFAAVISNSVTAAASEAAAAIAWQATNHQKLTSIHQFDRYCVIDCFQFFANGQYYYNNGKAHNNCSLIRMWLIPSDVNSADQQ